MSFLKEYTDEISKYHYIDIESINKLAHLLMDAEANSQKVYIIGNAGRAALSIHFANNLFIKCGIKARSLVENMSTFTSFANDKSYIDVFYEQLDLFKNYNNDVVICLTVSGNSPNIIKACQIKNNYVYAGLTANNGGKVKEYLDININVPTSVESIAEIIFLTIMNYIVEYIKYYTIEIQKEVI